MPPDLALWLTCISLNYPCLEHIFIVQKVFEPLKSDCIYLLVGQSYYVDIYLLVICFRFRNKAIWKMNFINLTTFVHILKTLYTCIVLTTVITFVRFSSLSRSFFPFPLNTLFLSAATSISSSLSSLSLYLCFLNKYSQLLISQSLCTPQTSDISKYIFWFQKIYFEISVVSSKTIYISKWTFISNYWYLKVNFLVPENLLWNISSFIQNYRYLKVIFLFPENWLWDISSWS